MCEIVIFFRGFQVFEALLNFDGTIALATPKSVLLIRFQSSVRLGEVSLG